MTPTINLERNLRPFEKCSEHFYLLAPNRFLVPLSNRRSLRGNRKRVGWKFHQTGVWVIGTLNDRFDKSGKFLMNDVTFERLRRSEGLEANEIQNMLNGQIPDLDAARFRDAIVRFELSLEDILSLKKAVRLFRSFPRRTKAKQSLAISADRQGICFDISDKENGISYRLNQAGKVLSPFVGSIFVETLKFLKLEDYAVCIDATGVIEMIGIESGIVFLFPAETNVPTKWTTYDETLPQPLAAL